MPKQIVMYPVLAVALPFLFGCAETAHHADRMAEPSLSPVLEARVREAYKQARASMLQEKYVQADVLWVLHQFTTEDKELVAFIERSKGEVFHPHYVPGVFPDLPRVELPEYPGRGTQRFGNYVRAAFGQPRGRALSWIKAYTETKEEGYILTHQFLALIWAEQAGFSLTEEMRSCRQELWQRIYEEQRSVDGVDSIDLYMERISIVLLYGCPDDVDQNAVNEWVEQIVDQQLEDGAWLLSKTRITYDGVSTIISSPRSHTTALAMMAMAAYLDPK